MTPKKLRFCAFVIEHTIQGCVARNNLRQAEVVNEPHLRSHLEEAHDELRLPLSVSAVQSFDLPFMYHVERFNAFECSLGGVERAETLHRPPPPSDEVMVLLNDIVEVFNTTKLAIRGQDRSEEHTSELQSRQYL